MWVYNNNNNDYYQDGYYCGQYLNSSYKVAKFTMLAQISW